MSVLCHVFSTCQWLSPLCSMVHLVPWKFFCTSCKRYLSTMRSQSCFVISLWTIAFEIRCNQDDVSKRYVRYVDLYALYSKDFTMALNVAQSVRFYIWVSFDNLCILLVSTWSPRMFTRCIMHSPEFGFVTKTCRAALFTGKVLIFWLCFHPSPSYPVLRDVTASPAFWTTQCPFSPGALELWHKGNGRAEVWPSVWVCALSLLLFFVFSSYFCSSVVFYGASSSGAEPFFFVFAQFICIQMICSLPFSSSLLVSCLWVMSLWESDRGWKV